MIWDTSQNCGHSQHNNFTNKYGSLFRSFWSFYGGHERFELFEMGISFQARWSFDDVGVPTFEVHVFVWKKLCKIVRCDVIGCTFLCKDNSMVHIRNEMYIEGSSMVHILHVRYELSCHSSENSMWPVECLRSRGDIWPRLRWESWTLARINSLSLIRLQNKSFSSMIGIISEIKRNHYIFIYICININWSCHIIPIIYQHIDTVWRLVIKVTPNCQWQREKPSPCKKVAPTRALGTLVAGAAPWPFLFELCENDHGIIFVSCAWCFYLFFFLEFWDIVLLHFFWFLRYYVV